MEREMSCVNTEEVKYNGLTMVEMTYEEAYKFAKQYGMNAIVYNKQTEQFNLYRVTRSGENLEMTKEGLWGYRTEPVDREKHIIYWIGGKE